MKILYVYHEYYNRHKKFGDIMSGMGHHVIFKEIFRKVVPGQVSLTDVSKEFDLIWLLSPFYISHKVITDKAIKYVKSKNIPIIIYSTFSTGIPYPDMMDTWEKIDFIFIMNKEAANFLSNSGLKAFYMPMGFHPDQYYPISLKQKYDIAFMGSAQSTVKNSDEDKRVRYLKALAKKIPIQVFGGRFNEKGLKSIQYSTHKEQRETYCMSKINLDLPFINSPHIFYKNKMHIKDRFFEIPASGGFLLTAKHDDFIDILDETMVGYYEDDIDSLIEEAGRYLENPELRKRMSQKAYDIICKKHTYGDRFGEHSFSISFM